MEPARKKELKERTFVFKGGHLHHCYTDKRIRDDASVPERSRGGRVCEDE